MKVLLLLFLICHIILSVHSLDCDQTKTVNTETLLRQKLFCNYDNTVRPVLDHSATTTVRLKYIIKSFEYVGFTIGILPFSFVYFL